MHVQIWACKLLGLHVMPSWICRYDIKIFSLLNSAPMRVEVVPAATAGVMRGSVGLCGGCGAAVIVLTPKDLIPDLELPHCVALACNDEHCTTSLSYTTLSLLYGCPAAADAPHAQVSFCLRFHNPHNHSSTSASTRYATWTEYDVSQNRSSIVLYSFATSEVEILAAGTADVSYFSSSFAHQVWGFCGHTLLCVLYTGVTPHTAVHFTLLHTLHTVHCCTLVSHCTLLHEHSPVHIAPGTQYRTLGGSTT
jgi:hypothetical protein